MKKVFLVLALAGVVGAASASTFVAHKTVTVCGDEKKGDDKKKKSKKECCKADATAKTSCADHKTEATKTSCTEGKAEKSCCKAKANSTATTQEKK